MVDLPSNLYVDMNFCEHGYFDVCHREEHSVKDCLLCLRENMNSARKAYLDFYKNVFMPWNYDRKDGDVDG